MLFTKPNTMELILKVSEYERYSFNVGVLPTKDSWLTDNTKVNNTEYLKDGFFIRNQLGFFNLMTCYFKDVATLLNNINKKYHSEILELIKLKKYYANSKNNN